MDEMTPPPSGGTKRDYGNMLIEHKGKKKKGKGFSPWTKIGKKKEGKNEY
jgi:hypothetical protein